MQPTQINDMGVDKKRLKFIKSFFIERKTKVLTGVIKFYILYLISDNLIRNNLFRDKQIKKSYFQGINLMPFFTN
jgi:hypothetical protein